MSCFDKRWTPLRALSLALAASGCPGAEANDGDATGSSTAPDSESTSESSSSPSTTDPLPADASSESTGPEATCAAGEVQPCYSGPAPTQGIGECHDGVSACVAEAWSACEGESLPAFDDCVTPADENCDSQASACSGTPVWIDSIGGSLYEYVNDVTWIEADHVIAVGSMVSSHATFGDGLVYDDANGQGWIARYSVEDGSAEWVAQLGIYAPGGLDTLTSVTGVTSFSDGRIGVTGINFDDVELPFVGLVAAGTFVASYDGNGQAQWLHHFAHEVEGTSVCSSRIAALSGGGVVASGCATGEPPDLGNETDQAYGSRTIWWAKLSDEGALEGGHAIAGSNETRDVGVVATHDGGFAIAGGYQALGVPLAAIANPPAEGIFLAVHDEAGEVVTAVAFPAGSYSGARPAITVDGDFVLAGHGVQVDFGAGPVDAATYIARLGPDGALQSFTTFPGQSHALTIDAGGNVLIAGFSNSGVLLPGESGPLQEEAHRVFVVKLDSALTRLWTRIGLGDPIFAGLLQVGGLTSSPDDGSVVVGGMFTHTIDFGALGLNSGTSTEQGWLARFDP